MEIWKCQACGHEHEVKSEQVLMNLLCTHKEINDLAKKLAEIARCQTTAKQYFDWEPLAIELHKYVIYKDA